jgi:hypothetical protein
VQYLPSLALFFTLAATIFAQNEAVNSLTDEEKAAGWKLLFDGKAAPGLRGVQKSDFLKSGWAIKDGALVLAKDLKKMGKITGGDLTTTEAFLDFDFSFEWKLSVSANTGVRYLVRGSSGGSPAGFEYQLIDDVHHPEGLKGGPIRRTGALDGIIPPSPAKQLNEPEHWNQGRIMVQGNHVEHWLNGLKVVEYELGSRELMAAAQAAKARVQAGFGTKFKSPLVILDQGDEVSFRNLKIRLLAPTGSSATPGQPPPLRP